MDIVKTTVIEDFVLVNNGDLLQVLCPRAKVPRFESKLSKGDTSALSVTTSGQIIKLYLE